MRRFHTLIIILSLLLPIQPTTAAPWQAVLPDSTGSKIFRTDDPITFVWLTTNPSELETLSAFDKPEEAFSPTFEWELWTSDHPTNDKQAVYPMLVYRSKGELSAGDITWEVATDTTGTTGRAQKYERVLKKYTWKVPREIPVKWDRNLITKKPERVFFEFLLIQPTVEGGKNVDSSNDFQIEQREVESTTLTSSRPTTTVRSSTSTTEAVVSSTAVPITTRTPSSTSRPSASSSTTSPKPQLTANTSAPTEFPTPTPSDSPAPPSLPTTQPPSQLPVWTVIVIITGAITAGITLLFCFLFIRRRRRNAHAHPSIEPKPRPMEIYGVTPSLSDEPKESNQQLPDSMSVLNGMSDRLPERIHNGPGMSEDLPQRRLDTLSEGVPSRAHTSLGPLPDLIVEPVPRGGRYMSTPLWMREEREGSIMEARGKFG